MDHFYKVMRAMGQWEMLEEPSPKVPRFVLQQFVTM